MKKWMILIPVGAAAAAAAVLLGRKPAGDKPAAKKAAAPAVKNAKTAEYSFASGYKDAKTVKVSFDYDSERFSYSVVSEDFLTDTSDSHAGVLYGEDFGVQTEYTAYYAGEDFAAMSKDAAERFKGFAEAEFGGIKGIRYFEGGKLCLAFPGADADYVLISVVMKGDDPKQEYLKLPENSDVNAMLATLKIVAE